MWHVWGTGEVHARFLWGNLRDRDHLKGIRIERRIIKKNDLQER
jgi:hypothetical protein